MKIYILLIFTYSLLFGNAQKYNNIALQYYQNYKFQKALDNYKKASEFVDKQELAKSYNDMAECYKELYKFEEAQKYLFKALEIKKINLFKEKNRLKQIPIKYSIAKSYNNLAELYRFQRKYHKALEYYEKSESIRKKIIDILIESKYHNQKVLTHLQNDLATAYTNSGNYYGEIGDYKSSLEFYHKAIDIRIKIKKNLADNYVNMGRAYQKDGKIKEALENYKLSLKFRKNDNSNRVKITQWKAHTYTYMAQIYNEQKRFKKAMKFALDGQNLYLKISNKNSPYLATNYQSIAQIYFAQGDYNSSLKFNHKALDIRKRVLIDNTDVANSHYYLSRDYLMINDFNNSISHALSSFKLFIKNQKEHYRVLTNNQKRGYNKHYGAKAKFSNLFDIAYQYKNTLDKDSTEYQGLIKNIFDKWLSFKGKLSSQEDTISQLYQKVSTLKNSIDSLKSKKSYLASLYKQEYDDENKTKKLNLDIRNTKNEINQLEKQLNKTDKILQDFLALQNIYYQDIINLLKNNQIYIDFARAEDRYYIFTINREGYITFDMLSTKDTQRIDDNIKAFRVENTQIKKNKDINISKSKKYLSTLYKILIDKYLANKIKSKEFLIISPDGLLNFFPFEALYNNKYLIEDKYITYIPSAKYLMFNRKKLNISSIKDNIIVFAYPNYNKGINSKRKKAQCELDADNTTSNFRKNKYITSNEENIISRGFSDFNKYFQCLDGSLEELKYIKKIYQDRATIYQKNSATVDNLFKIKSPNILHIATHGFFLEEVSNEKLMQSGLLFAGANRARFNKDTDGIVTALSLSNLELLNTNLVVLSACDTGLGKIENAEGVVGLPKAFIQAGAKNIIMSLWNVDDSKTAILMKKFYYNLSQNNQQNYIDALREAKLSMINEHPYYWSGFILSGI